MTSLADLIALGERMGYVGEGLQTFVSKEQERERDERHKERLAKEKEMEHLAKKEEMEHLAKKEEMEQRTKLELARIELEKAKLTTSQPKESGSSGFDRPKIKLLQFIEGRDDMEAFLHRFQLAATAHKWNNDMCFHTLSGLLTGTALQCLHSLGSENQNYDSLKAALLKRFLITEEGFHTKFREMAPHQDEDIDSFVARLEKVCDRWLELASVEKGNYDQLRGLLLREQLYTSLHSSLVTFLKERAPKTLESIKELTTHYRSAYPNKPIGKDTLVANIATHHKKPEDNYTVDRERSRPASRGSQSSFSYPQHRRAYSTGPSGRYSNDRYDRQHGYRWPRQDGSDERFVHNKQFEEQSRWQTNFRGRDQSRRGRFRRGGNNFAYRGDNQQSGSYQKKGKFANVAQEPAGHTALSVTTVKKPGLRLVPGKVNGKVCTAMFDSGCNTIGVHQRLVSESDYTGRTETCVLFGGLRQEFRTAIVHVTSPWYTGQATVFVMMDSIADLIIGDFEGVNNPFRQLSEPADHSDDPSMDDIRCGLVTTRATARQENTTDKKDKAREEIRSEKNNTSKGNESGATTSERQEQVDSTQATDVDVDYEMFKREQQKDTALDNLRTLAAQEKGYFMRNNLLYRKSKKDKFQDQLVVPASLRSYVMKVCHESPWSAHGGVAATRKRVAKRFSWPKMYVDINRFVKSCDICQRITNKLPRIPIQSSDIVDRPFDKVAIDIVGPMQMSRSRNRYILTMVDTATRWCEGVALKEIKSTDVTNALFQIFSRLGMPREILSDNGKQLVSNAMEEVMKMLNIDRRLSTPYHAQSNGLVERFNGTLKLMLRKLTAENPETWDEMLPAVLFAYREVPNQTTGYSPFELMYGREVRGLADVIADRWTGDDDRTREYLFVHDYTEKLKSTIQDACRLAASNAESNLDRYRLIKNEHTAPRMFEKGEDVLVLLPRDGNNLYMRYQGPYKIVQAVGDNNYTVEIKGARRTYHANLLKRYTHREPSNPFDSFGAIAQTAYVEDEGEHEDSELTLQFPEVKQSEFPDNVRINPALSAERHKQMQSVLQEYSTTLSDLPGRTDVVEHVIRVTEEKPFRIKQYDLPVHAGDAVAEEIDKMIASGIIEPSSSPYASPITVVKKKDNTIRLCIDFRRLNSVTEFDAEPIPTLEELLTKMQGARFFSKLDLTKGYWQIPIREDCRHYTAFQTPRGLYHFVFMPFGLSTAASTFQKMMQRVVGNVDFIASYFDDVMVFSKTWDDHVRHVKETLDMLRNAGLTAKPSKASIGFTEVDFLGHVVSEGKVQPDAEKTQKIMDIKAPTTKKEVKRVLGLLGYYRRFVPNYSKVAQPLTDLTRKAQPNKVRWSEECQNSLEMLKNMLTAEPVLRVPNLDKPFVVQTDASNKAIAGVLLQEHHGTLLPCHYVSRRLLDREVNYAIIEKEALAIVYSLGKLAKYLIMRPFFIQTDHNPLTFLKKNQSRNARLSRWALTLQQFTFSISHISGASNVIADALSRAY